MSKLLINQIGKPVDENTATEKESKTPGLPVHNDSVSLDLENDDKDSTELQVDIDVKSPTKDDQLKDPESDEQDVLKFPEHAIIKEEETT